MLTLAVMTLEIIGGLYSGSLSLMADAGHMLSDVWALSVSMLAAYWSQRKRSQNTSHTSLELWAAALNACTLTITGIGILVSALQRWNQPSHVHAYSTLFIACVGLGANVLGLYALKPHNHNLNVRGAFLHLMADTLSSVAVVVSACVIAFTGWTRIDPLISGFIACVIILSSLMLGFRVTRTWLWSKK
jgi:cobalt-zinc-cadmium efflux system protein